MDLRTSYQYIISTVRTNSIQLMLGLIRQDMHYHLHHENCKLRRYHLY